MRRKKIPIAWIEEYNELVELPCPHEDVAITPRGDGALNINLNKY